MAGEAAEKNLYDAAEIGNLETFIELTQTPNALDDLYSLSCLRNALHIAITKGNLNIVIEVLRIKPEVARDVDSKKSSSLHIAAAQGNIEIAKKMLGEAPEMCYWLDDQGMNPIHIAAMKGRVEILEELLGKDLFPALERVHRGQTVLHLCVKHRQLEALVVLVEKFGDLACAKDDHGETLLHLAVRSNQLMMIRYLVGSKKIKQQTRNSMGKTALDILEDEGNREDPYPEIKLMLNSLSNESEQEAFPKISDMAMVVVVLIATMAFQAAVSPPGGVWQESTSSHSAGRAVMASTHPNIYKHFVRANTTAFVSSLITIFLITTEMPSKHFFFMVIATYTMWLSMASVGVSYGASLIMTNPIMETQSIGYILVIVASLFSGILVLIFLYSVKDSWSVKRKQENLDIIIERVTHPNFQQHERERRTRHRFVLDLFRTSASPPSPQVPLHELPRQNPS